MKKDFKKKPVPFLQAFKIIKQKKKKGKTYFIN